MILNYEECDIYIPTVGFFFNKKKKKQLVFSKVERINLFIITTKPVAEPDEKTSFSFVYLNFPEI